jgi:Helix-turn-helix domain
MSVRTMARVWADSRHGGPHLLMLLSIADFADDDGNAYPSVQTLATKCRMKARNARLVLAALRESGELQVRTNGGPAGANRYRITMQGGLQELAGVQGLAGLQKKAHTPARKGTYPLQELTAKPSLNHHEPEESSRKRSHSPSAARGTRLPENWKPTADLIAYCGDKRPDLNPNEVAEAFRDYWHAKPGKDGRKLEWSATWRTWVRNQRAGVPGPKQRQPVLDDSHVFGDPA